MPMREDTGPTVDPSRFRGAGEPYSGHWREFPASWPSLEQRTPPAETRLQVAAAIARLPDRERVAITLRDVEGYSPTEVCTMLNISAREQRLLLHRARAFVRAHLEEYFKTQQPRPDTDWDQT
jgi:RNA polymerase sigma-70 factor (ECF subfamily)